MIESFRIKGNIRVGCWMICVERELKIRVNFVW